MNAFFDAAAVNADARLKAAPTATLRRLRQRAALLQAVRQFFQQHGYWEVETPVLSQETVIDLHLEPFPVQGDYGSGLSKETFYLQTSPEFAMKRLLASGADRIFQITRAFRQGERGTLHNPEFSMLEWYALGEDHFEQMQFVEQLCRAVFQRAAEEFADLQTADHRGINREGATWEHVAPSQNPAATDQRSVSQQAERAVVRSEMVSLPVGPFQRLSYAEAFQQVLGLDVLAAPIEQLLGVCHDLRLPVETEQTLLQPDEYRDDLLNLLLADQIEPWLKTQGAVFVYAYPVSQAALARVSPDDPRVAERFELYLHGIELCNGYHELTDAAELARRNGRQSALRQARGLPPLPQESRLIHAMQHGLPPCSGVAVGLDRLLMLALQASQLADVIAFPIEIA